MMIVSHSHGDDDDSQSCVMEMMMMIVCHSHGDDDDDSHS
jgi:hypothetical protein